MNYVDRTVSPRAFNGYGVASPTIKIRLVGATTTSGPWPSVIERARNAWNNAGTGVNITTTTSGSSQYKLRVVYDSGEEWYGMTTTLPSVGVAAASIIEINEYGLRATSTDFRRGVVAHEIGHLLGLADDPYPSTDLNRFASLMSYSRDRNIVTAPQMADIFHVRNIYK